MPVYADHSEPVDAESRPGREEAAARAPFDESDEYRPEPPPAPVVPAWQDGGLRIGIHTSIAGDIVAALDAARALGANAVQIFTASPRSWPAGAAARIASADAQRFRARRAELALGPVVVHANYLINLAAVNPVLRARSIQAFHDEIQRCLDLGADYLVAHPGSAGEAGPHQGVAGVAGALRHSARGLRLGGLRILLENTAGQGAALGARLEELAAILRACPELPLGVCLDTAHLLAAGYDLRSAEGLERTLEAVERTIGLRRVFVLHMNDSKTPLGSRVDRHAHIGQGYIGRQAFQRILTHPLLAPSQPSGAPSDQATAGQPGRRIARAFILETPVDRPGDDRRNVRLLWTLAGVPAPAPAGAAARPPRRSRPARKRAAGKRPGRTKRPRRKTPYKRKPR